MRCPSFLPSVLLATSRLIVRSSIPSTSSALATLTAFGSIRPTSASIVLVIACEARR